MSREYIYGDISNHAGDVRMLARDLEYYVEKKDETKIRSGVLAVLRAADRLNSDLSSLEYRIGIEREAEELRRNPLPHTLPLPLKEGVS